MKRKRRSARKRVLSMKEIERRYDGEWVLIVNPEVDELTRIRRGEVIHHGLDREEVYRVAHQRKDAHTAILFIGGPPKDMLYVLLRAAHLLKSEVSSSSYVGA